MILCYSCWLRPEGVTEGEYRCSKDVYTEGSFVSHCPYYDAVNYGELLVYILWPHQRESFEVFTPGEHGLYPEHTAKKALKASLIGRGAFDKKHIMAAYRFTRRRVGQSGKPIQMSPDVQKVYDGKV